MTTKTPPRRLSSRRLALFRLLAACVLLVALVRDGPGLAGGSLCAASPPTPHSTVFPPVKLRGYGTVAGTFTAMEIHGQSAGVLRIECQDQEKARLLLSKYLSDVQLLPGVKTSQRNLEPWRGGASRSRRTPLAVYVVEKQGFVVAARSGATVWILASPSVTGLDKLVEQYLATGTPVSSTAEVHVPMYLDRWDKYGFRFYYAPFLTPQDANHHEVSRYDPRRISPLPSSRAGSGWSCGIRPSAPRRRMASSILTRENGCFRPPNSSNCLWA